MINVLLPLARFFESNLGAMTRKVLAAAGIGVISFTAVTAAFNAAVAYTRGHYDSIAVDALQLIGLAGLGEALGLIVGAITARLTITSMSKLGVIPK